MTDGITWSVVLACPGEDELALLAELSARRDARIVAVADPDGSSLGAELAEIMGIPVVPDLEGLDPQEITFLVHPDLNEAVAALVDDATDLGIALCRADLFAQRLRSPLGTPARTRTAGTRSPDLEFLEDETAAIHRTLSRVEEALDRESLLRWVLGLAMRAVGAGAGSIMLMDDAADELYVAFARGLSEATLHATRVRPGEGIAGRVALSGRPERITAGGNPGRDRGQLSDAVCAPIRREGRLLGVLNLSSTAADGPLAKDALSRVESLSHRLAVILERFLRLQEVGDSERLRSLDETLALDGFAEGEPLDLLTGWTARLAVAVGAEDAEVGLLTSDGDLCVIGQEVRHECPPDHDKASVLVRGVPAVVRPGPAGDARTVIHLPLGREPVRAVLSLAFARADAAHHFRETSGSFLYIVHRHLGHALDRIQRSDEINRLTSLASALSSLAEVQGDEGAVERTLAAARRLTGAEQATIVEDGPPGDRLRDEARRLLHEAGERGWQASVLDGARRGDGEGLGILVVPLDTTRPLPGLVMVGKTRVHALDARTFTETDARFARRLLPMLEAQRHADPVRAAEPADTGGEAAGGTDAVMAHLRRELDRCDRYHTMVGLAAFRLPGFKSAGTAAEMLAGRLRSSDMVGCLDDGTVLVIVPEEVQSLPRLQKRVQEMLQSITGAAEAVIRSASAVYPGAAGDAAALLTAVTRPLGGPGA